MKSIILFIVSMGSFSLGYSQLEGSFLSLGIGQEYGRNGLKLEYPYSKKINPFVVVGTSKINDNYEATFGLGLHYYILGQKTPVEPRINIFYGAAEVHPIIKPLENKKIISDNIHYGLLGGIGLRWTFSKNFSFDFGYNILIYPGLENYNEKFRPSLGLVLQL